MLTCDGKCKIARNMDVNKISFQLSNNNYNQMSNKNIRNKNKNNHFLLFNRSIS